MPALVPLQDPTQYAAQVTRFTNQGETQYSDENPFLVDRLSLVITSGTGVYSIPDYVKAIRRITWLGEKLDPLGQRNFREVFQSATQLGKPFWYVFNNVGQNKIQFFPNPNQSLAAGAAVWGADIATSCVIEFYRISDNSTFVLPAFNRDQMLKQFVNQQMYAIDGPGINLKASKYFGERWSMRKLQMTKLLNELISKPRKLVVSNIATQNYFPASPVLPIARFGIGVDQGE